MTIAACYLTSEGVVLGADSTSSFTVADGLHYLNYNQKLFEIGENSTLGALTWGLGAVSDKSYRTLFALLADDISKKSPASVEEVAKRWIDQFWQEYSTALAVSIKECKTLHTKLPFDKNADPVDPQARTELEEKTYQNLKQSLVVGFCVAGYLPTDRIPAAFAMVFDPLASKPTATALQIGTWSFWGAPNMIQRLIFGCDSALKDTILKSDKWIGTENDLVALLNQYHLATLLLPIREAIDFVHSCIHSTIKALKFSNLSQICGGPIEIAVITTDRRFRWVRHKSWDMATTEGESS